MTDTRRVHSSFHSKRSLGQNFLIDENIAQKIVQAVDAQPDDILVEIGPGFGALTKYFVEIGNRYYAIEIDERLIPDLQKKFGHLSHFKLIHNDFRKVELAQFAGKEKIKLVGNIPYHITSHIVFTAFSQRELLKDITLTVQKEVAERIVADPGGKDYSVISIISQTFAKVRILFSLSHHVFRPRPEINSAVVQWHIQPPPLEIVDEKFFLTIVKTIFSQRRKTLRRSLKKYLDPTNDSIEKMIDLQRRPETLSIKEIILLANSLKSHIAT